MTQLALLALMLAIGAGLVAALRWRRLRRREAHRRFAERRRRLNAAAWQRMLDTSAGPRDAASDRRRAG